MAEVGRLTLHEHSPFTIFAASNSVLMKESQFWVRLRSLWRAEAKNMVAIILGIAVYAIGFTIFILPHHVVIGGMAGLGALVFYATSGLIPVAVTMYGTNIILLAVSYKYLGKGFVFRTIFGMTVASIFIGSLEGYFTSHPPLVADATLSVLLGAMLLGVGIGIYYSHHGTTGGTDIVAAVMSKLSNVSVGRVMMIVDMSIVACSFFLPFDGDMEARVQARTQTILYGWIAIFLYSYITDKFLNEGRQTVQFIILSDNWAQIAYRITHEAKRGVTTLDAAGYWTGMGRKMLLVWCRKPDTYQIYQIVKEEDPTAYITTSFVQSVYGNGFDTLRIKDKKRK